MVITFGVYKCKLVCTKVDLARLEAEKVGHGICHEVTIDFVMWQWMINKKTLCMGTEWAFKELRWPRKPLCNCSWCVAYSRITYRIRAAIAYSHIARCCWFSTALCRSNLWDWSSSACSTLPVPTREHRSHSPGRCYVATPLTPSIVSLPYTISTISAPHWPQSWSTPIEHQQNCLSMVMCSIPVRVPLRVTPLQCLYMYALATIPLINTLAWTMSARYSMPMTPLQPVLSTNCTNGGPNSLH